MYFASPKEQNVVQYSLVHFFKRYKGGPHLLKNHLSIPVILNEKQFKNFIIFDSMTKNKRWKTSVSLAVMCFFLATLCYASLESFPKVEALGNILIVICVFIPTNYFRSFYNSVKQETEKMKLGTPRQVYTINLSTSSNGIRYFYPNETTAAGQYSWKSVSVAWKTRDAIYLYVTPEQALIIPKTTQSPDYDSIWQFIKSNLMKSQIREDS